MTVLLEPSWSVRARSLLATAHAATLSTGCPRTGTTTTPVPLEDRGDGLPVVVLDAASPAVAGLARCRVATLLVSAPDEAWGLRLHVSLRMGRPDADGVRAYEPTLLSVRVTGPRSRTIPVAEFLRTTPDPAHARAESALAHLGSTHAEALLTHVRGLGLAAQAVVPLGVDGTGVELAVLAGEGVTVLHVDDVSLCDC